MAVSTSALQHPDGSGRWAGDAEWADIGGSDEGRGSRQVKADGGGLQGLGFQINLPGCVVNVQAAHNSCRWLPSVTVQLYDKYFPSHLESHIFCFWLMNLWRVYWDHFFTALTGLYHKCVVMFPSPGGCFPQCCNWASDLFCSFPPPKTPPQPFRGCHTTDFYISIYKRTSTQGIKDAKANTILPENLWYNLKQHLTLFVLSFTN